MLEGAQAPEREVGGYRVGRLLGQGGMGAVYVARDALGGQVVLKLIHPKFVDHRSAAARFAREASVTASLSHPGIVRVLGSELEGEQPFIAMEYVEGRTLGALLRDEGPLGVARARALIEQVLSAVRHAHEHGVVHRDLKPANLMVTSLPDGTEEVKVLDFGIAGLFDGVRHTRLTQTGQVLGTPGYLAPEQVQGDDVDGRADLWAIGVIFYAMLANRLPFPGATAPDRVIAMLTQDPVAVTEYRPGLPAEVVAVLDRMLTKEPAGRYQTAVEAALAVASAVPRDWDDTAASAVSSVVAARTSHGNATVQVAPATRTPVLGEAELPGPKRFWSRPGGIAVLFFAALVAGVVVSGVVLVAVPSLFDPGGQAPSAEASGRSIDVGGAAAPVSPVQITDLGPTLDPAARPRLPTPADPEAAPPGDDEHSAGQASSGPPRPPGETMVSPDRPALASTSHARAGQARGCARGADLGSYLPGLSEGGTASFIAYNLFRSGFQTARRGGCLDGVRAGQIAVELHFDADAAVSRVNFTDPGPLTRTMQACVRRSVRAAPPHQRVHGPGVTRFVRIALVCR